MYQDAEAPSVFNTYRLLVTITHTYVIHLCLLINMCRFLTYEIHQLFDDAVSAWLVADFIELVAKFFFGYQPHIGKVGPRAAPFA